MVYENSFWFQIITIPLIYSILNEVYFKSGYTNFTVKAKEVSPVESTQPSLSYDELRQRNRQEHEHAVGSSSRNPFRQQAFRTPEVVPSQESVPAFSSSVQSETENAFRAPENTDRPSASSRGTYNYYKPGTVQFVF